MTLLVGRQERQGGGAPVGAALLPLETEAGATGPGMLVAPRNQDKGREWILPQGH